MDEYLLELQAKLDEAKSKGLINADIDKIQQQIDKLKLQAEIDPKSISNITKQLSSLLNQNIVIDNIKIDSSKTSKTTQQTGQKIGDDVKKSVQQSLSLDDVIDKQVTDLMTKYGAVGKKGSMAFNEIRQAVVDYRQELINANNTDIDFDELDFFANAPNINNVTSALTKHIRTVNVTKEAYADLVNYIKDTNKNNKVFLPDSIVQEYGEDFASMQKQLGKAFNTNYGVDFETFVTELNGQLGNVIDLSQGAEVAFGDLVKKVTSARGNKSISGNELFNFGLDKNEIEQDITSAINIITEEEKKLAQISTKTANTIVQNEEKKQQAIQETANTQSSANNPDLDLSENIQKIEQFKESLVGLGTVDGQYVDKLSERFGELGIKIQSVNASMYKTGTDEILSTTIKGIDKYGQAVTLTESWNQTNHEFVKSLDAVGSSFQDVQKHVTTYQTKLNDLKTKYSNASVDYSGFEKVLDDFQKGIGTVDDLKLSFNELENSAKLGVQSLKSQSASFDPIQQALNNMRDMPFMLKTLEASMDGVKDKTSLAGISVKDFSDKYNALQAEMNRNGGKIPLTEEWTSDYRELMSTVTSATKQVEALKKAEASDNSQATKQANYYSSILASYRQMYDIKKKLLSAGEEEAKVLEAQRKSLSASIASNYKQLNNQGLTDKDWQSQVDSLKKTQEYQLKLTSARIEDKSAIQEQNQVEKELVATLKEQQTIQNKVDKIQLSLDTGEYESKVQNLIARTQQWTDAEGNARISTLELSSALDNLNAAHNALAKNNTAENQQALINAEKNLSTQIKTVTNDVRSMNAEFMKSSAVDSLRQKVQQFYDLNGKSHRTYGTDLKRIMSELGSGMEVPIAKGKELEQEFIRIQNEARQTGQLGKTWFQTIKEGMSSFGSWLSATTLVMTTINKTRQEVSTVNELDTALVDLRKTANMTTQQLEDFYYASNDVAKQMGVTTEEILNQASAWSRLNN